MTLDISHLLFLRKDVGIISRSPPPDCEIQKMPKSSVLEVNIKGKIFIVTPANHWAKKRELQVLEIHKNLL